MTFQGLRGLPVANESVAHIGGLNHVNLLDHPQVYDVLRGALTTPVRGGIA